MSPSPLRAGETPFGQPSEPDEAGPDPAEIGPDPDEAGPEPDEAGPGPAGRDPALRWLALLIVVSVALYGTDTGSWAVQVLICWPVMTVLHVGLTVLAWRVRRCPGAPVGVRRVWGGVAFAGAAFAVGDVVQLGLLLTGDVEVLGTGGNAQGVCVLVGTVGLLGVLLTSPTGLASPRDRIRFGLDLAVVMTASAAFSIYTYVPRDGQPLEVLLNLLIGPVPFIVGVFAAVRLVLSPRPPVTAAAGLVAGAAALLEGVVQAASGPLLAHDLRSWVLGLNVVANALLTASARIQGRQVRTPPGDRNARARRRYSLLPYAAIAATYLLLCWVIAGVHASAQIWIVVTGAVVTSSLVTVRQLMAFTENAQLLDRLDGQVVELHQSIAERERLATSLHHQATHDPLTGLANRTLLAECLERAVSVGPAPGRGIALVVIDLDDFKPVNDRYGHAVGDELLVATAGRLRGSVHDRGLVARLGGDEFAVLIEDAGNDVEQVAARMVSTLTGPFQLSGVVVDWVSASVGLAIARGPCTAEDLLHQSDTAMYAAKRAGRGGYRIAELPTPQPSSR